MKSFDRRLPGPLARGRRYCIPIALVFAVSVVVVAALAAGCGSSGSTPATTGQGGGATPIQVLTSVQRGDLVESATGSVKLVVSKGKTMVLAQVAKPFASSVATGQTATLVFFTPRTGGQSGQSGTPFPQNGQSGAPVPQGGQSGAPFGQGGSGDGALRGRGTPGTVAAVKTNADGSATVTITVKKLPAAATAKSVGFATIQTKVLASDVIVIPKAAIKGRGSSATVQVLSGGKTSTRSVVVGQQAGTQSEIVSGLNVGENVVWTRSFQRGGFGGSGSPVPGQGQQGFGGGQSGSGQSGAGVQ